MQALHGLKVIELGLLIAGPFAGKTLADFGADVIKIEPHGVGDPPPMRAMQQRLEFDRGSASGPGSSYLRINSGVAVRMRARYCPNLGGDP